MKKNRLNEKSWIMRTLFTVFICFGIAVSGFAQTKPIKGAIFDASTGEPIIGASVTVTGTQRGIATGIDGGFSLEAAPNETLTVTYLGYVTQKVSVGNKTTFNIQLQENAANLEEVVIVGYGARQKATLTGAVSQIKNEEIVITKNENVVNMMSGKLPGLRVWQRSAEPGNFDRTKFDIRGYGNPLIVIDGVPQGNEVFNRIDPEDIENISILKDASAAIYGVRAANGVILVTTKRGGKESKFNVSYSYNHGWQSFLYMPDNVDAIDYMTLSNEKGKRSFDNNFPSNAAPAYSESEIDAYRTGQLRSTNWSSATMKKSAPQSQHNLGLSGESKNVKYFFNLGYMDQGGIFQSGDVNYNRWNIRSNNTITILDNLRAQINLNGYIDNKNQPHQDMWTIFKAAWNIPPVYQVYANDNPNYYDYYRRHDNPVAWQESDMVGFRDNKKRDFQGQGVLEWDVPGIKGLQLKAMYNYHFNHSTEDEYNHAYYLYEYRPATNESPEQYLPTAMQSPSFDALRYWESVNTLIQASANYSRTFGSHSVDAFLGYEESEGEGYDFSARRNIELELPYIAAGVDADQRGSGGFPWHNVRKSIIGKFGYNYGGKYLIDFNFRRDGSSVFPPKNRWGSFGSGLIGYRISEESFIKDNFDFINNIKLRASYGVMGDDGALNYQHISGYNYPNNGYIINGVYVNGVSSRGMTNELLTWSTSKTANYGIDFDLFNGLIGGQFEYFNRDRDGLFERKLAQFPGSVGVSLPQENLNSDRNFGYELSLTHQNRVGELGYHINGNVTYARHKNRYQEQNPFGSSYDEWKNRSGYRYSGIWWGRDYAGQFQNYNQIYSHPVNTGGGNQSVVPGDYYYKDWNNDGFIDDEDNHPIASYNMPLINFGLSLGAAWKGFDLNLLFQGSSMFYVRYEEQYHEPLMFGSGSAMVRFLDRWHTVNPNDNIFDPNTQWVSGYYASMGSALEDGTRAVQNASYVRLKSAEIGYTFPKRWLSSVKVDGLRVYINGYNLLTFTGLVNYDPEHPGATVNNDDWNNAQGGYYYPNNKTFNLGFKVSF